MSLYTEIKNLQPDTTECFWAFSNQQYHEGVKNKNLQDKKLYSAGGSLYGTLESLNNMAKFYENIAERIKNECDPQMIYDHEFWNHECEYVGSDTEAIQIVIDLYGSEKAKTVNRKYALFKF